MADIKVGVGAIIIADSKILLTKRVGSHASGSFGTLGGHLEFGESPTDALQREAMEELNIELTNIQFLSCANLLKYNRHVINLLFTAKIKDVNQLQIQEPDKIESFGWFEINNLPEPLFEPVRIDLKALETGQNYFQIME
ncbi:MAG: NUDIX hydrolase [Patescibacteria group bacterium]